MSNRSWKSSVRKYWFGSYIENEPYFTEFRRELRKFGFEPILFKKAKGKPEKRVDIAVAKEMLVNAFNSNYDIGILISGDEDYVDLVNEVKRYGQVIVGAFFKNSLSPKLQLACDNFDLIKPPWRFGQMPEDQKNLMMDSVKEELKGPPYQVNPKNQKTPRSS